MAVPDNGDRNELKDLLKLIENAASPDQAATPLRPGAKSDRVAEGARDPIQLARQRRASPPALPEMPIRSPAAPIKAATEAFWPSNLSGAAIVAVSAIAGILFGTAVVVIFQLIDLQKLGVVGSSPPPAVARRTLAGADGRVETAVAAPVATSPEPGRSESVAVAASTVPQSAPFPQSPPSPSGIAKTTTSAGAATADVVTPYVSPPQSPVRDSGKDVGKDASKGDVITFKSPTVAAVTAPPANNPSPNNSSLDNRPPAEEPVRSPPPPSVSRIEPKIAARTPPEPPMPGGVQATLSAGPRVFGPAEWQAPPGRRTPFPFAFEPHAQAHTHHVLVMGLEPSATILRGIEIIEGTWMLRASDLPEAVIDRKPGAPERTKLSIEARSDAGAVVNRLDVTMLATGEPKLIAGPSSTGAVAQPGPAPSNPVAGNPSAAEAGRLLQQARQLLGRGDIANARLLLEHAVELGNPDAALELGATYTAARGKTGAAAAGDLQLARDWYERAAALGSDEARRRIAAMPVK